MSVNRPLPRRPKRKRHPLQAVGDAATLGGAIIAMLLFLGFCILTIVMPVALMGAAIYFLLTH